MMFCVLELQVRSPKRLQVKFNQGTIRYVYPHSLVPTLALRLVRQSSDGGMPCLLSGTLFQHTDPHRKDRDPFHCHCVGTDVGSEAAPGTGLNFSMHACLVVHMHPDDRIWLLRDQLSNAQDIAQPFGESLSGLTGQLQNLLNQSPDVNVPISGEQSQTWLITTFLDEVMNLMAGNPGALEGLATFPVHSVMFWAQLNCFMVKLMFSCILRHRVLLVQDIRVSRGDMGSVFVLAKNSAF